MAFLKCRPIRVTALAVALVMPGGIRGQAVNEYEVKAAFLFNFTRFVEWPPSSARRPFCIGIAGSDPFGGALDEAIKGHMAGGRAIVIKHFKAGDPPADCDIVFFSSADRKKLTELLLRLKGAAVLTVGDTPGFCASGGDIGFAVEGDKIKLEINPDAAQRAGLQISSKLLSLAALVREPGQ
jgi:hypothetical protein